ncbi:6-phosphofructo-2-kinase/fructose-2,6-bisphosphatase-like, partial [Dendrobium catenatum]
MGSSSSKHPTSSHDSLDEGGSGGQLYVSLKLENFNIRGDLIPHVFGSVPIIGSWDPSRALRMERESASMWELSFVVPPNHETLHFHFLLKPKDREGPYVVEDGADRLLIGGNLEGDARTAVFRPPEDGHEATLEYKVFVKVDNVSPFDLAASWRAYKENLRPSTVRGIPDISINAAPEGGQESGSTTSLELDLESYVVPLPSCAGAAVYAANLAETPRSVGYHWESPKYDVSSISPSSSTTRVVAANHAAPNK